MGLHTPSHPQTIHMLPALLQEKAKRKFTVFEGDHLTLLNVYRAFEKVKREGLATAVGGCPAACLMVPALLLSTAGAHSGVARTSSTTEA